MVALGGGGGDGVHGMRLGDGGKRSMLGGGARDLLVQLDKLDLQLSSRRAAWQCLPVLGNRGSCRGGLRGVLLLLYRNCQEDGEYAPDCHGVVGSDMPRGVEKPREDDE